MQVIGFNFKKMSAEKRENITRSNISTNIKFLEVVKEQINLLKDTEGIKISFQYDLTYDSPNKEDKEGKKEQKEEDKKGQVLFEGDIMMSLDKQEAKEILKAWKKQKLPSAFQVPLYNLILKKCTPKAVHLQDEIGLPSHIPMPRLTPKKED